jgi:hypothetical protein
LARVRRAAAELAPEAIEQIAQRVVALMRSDGPALEPETQVRLVDATQLARRLGVTRAWVYEHATELGAIAIGDGPRSRLRFDAAVAAEVLETRRRRGLPQATVTPPSAPPRRRPRRQPATAAPLLPIHRRSARADVSRIERSRRRSY